MKTKPKLTKLEKRRLAVVNDAIAQIKLKRYEASPGDYITGRIWDDITAASYESQLQDVLLESTKTCEVCAKGALFCSLVRKENDVKVIDFRTNSETLRESKLAKLFGKTQANLIEIYFEGLSGTVLDEIIPDAEERLLTILKNMK